MLLPLLSGSIAAFILALIACAVIRGYAVRHALLDRPNERSLHQTPVPRLGGVALVLGASAGGLALVLSGVVSPHAAVWFAIALGVSLLGLVDDLRPLGAATRFVAQIGLSVATLVVLDVRTDVALTSDLVVHLPRPVLAVLGVVWIVACLNIYNFMDGMDGLAGSQAVLGAVGAAAAAALTGRHELLAMNVVVATGAAGFLAHNWPPARIFMGDAGSTFLGFFFAAQALAGSTTPTDAVPFAATAVALSPFLLDATFTIFRRVRRREAIWRAHRTHLYQRAVATGLTHHDVLLRYLVWMAAETAAAAWCARGTTATIVAAITTLLGLALVWAWVRRREQRSAERPALA